MLDLVPDGSSWDEVVQLAKAVERAGATIINTGIGWHEARVPDHRHLGAARGLRLGDAEAEGRGRASRSAPRTASTRPRWPSSVLADGCADMVSMARPLLADAEFVNKAARRPRRRDQHLHRLQPGVPRPRLPAQDRLLPGQPARLPRDGARDRARAARRKRIAVVGAGPAGPRLRDHAGRARPRGRPVRGRGGDRRPVQHGEAHPGQGGVPRDAALLRRAASRRPACTCARPRVSRRASSPPAATTRSCSPPASRRATRASRATRSSAPRQGALLRRRAAARQAGRPARRGRRRGRHRLRRRRVPGAATATRPRSTPPAWLREWGVADPARRARRPRQAASSTPPRAPGVPAAAQGRAARQGPRQDHGLDPPRRAQDEARRDDRRRELRAHRRARPARQLRRAAREADAARGGHGRAVRRAGAAARAGRAAARPRARACT